MKTTITCPVCGMMLGIPESKHIHFTCPACHTRLEVFFSPVLTNCSTHAARAEDLCNAANLTPATVAKPWTLLLN